MTSILDDIKHVLGILPENTAFDQDVIIFTNSALSILTQLNVGPEQGFEISGYSEVWEDFIDDKRLNAVKSYVYLRVRLLFDPPTTGYTTTAFAQQITELEYRLNVVADYG